MNISSRCAVAAHTLTLLAQAHAEEQPVTSEVIAASVNTNPVVIRRIMGNLREAGLVTSQPGAGGGWRLLRCPGEINLLDVYRAVEEKPLFALHSRPPSATCPVGKNVQGALGLYFGKAEEAMQKQLSEVTLAQLLDTTLEAAGRSTPKRKQ